MAALPFLSKLNETRLARLQRIRSTTQADPSTVTSGRANTTAHPHLAWMRSAAAVSLRHLVVVCLRESDFPEGSFY